MAQLTSIGLSLVKNAEKKDWQNLSNSSWKKDTGANVIPQIFYS